MGAGALPAPGISVSLMPLTSGDRRTGRVNDTVERRGVGIVTGGQGEGPGAVRNAAQGEPVTGGGFAPRRVRSPDL